MMITITMFCVVFVTYLCSSRLTRNMSPVDATSTPLQHHHSSYQDDATLMRIRIKIKMMFMKRWWMVIIKPWLRKPSSDKKKTFWTFWPELGSNQLSAGRAQNGWSGFILFYSFLRENGVWRGPQTTFHMGQMTPNLWNPHTHPIYLGLGTPSISFHLGLLMWFFKVWDHLCFRLMLSS